MHIRKHSLRFISVFLSFVFLLLLFQVRLVLIQIFRSEHLAKLAEKQHDLFLKLEPRRGGIYDRNASPLAMNVTAYSLFANPRLMSESDKEKAIGKLPRIIDVEPDVLESLLHKDKYFVWLARKLPVDKAEEIKSANIHGIDFKKESKRFYPNKFLAAHTVGFAGVDNQGLEGIELKFDSYLKGNEGWSRIVRDARMKNVFEKILLTPQDGFDITLTIDETIQFIAEHSLDKAFKKHNAKGASIIVVNPKTGEILALANRPTFDLHQFSKSDPDERRNRAISDMYEPGSVFKIVTAAAALETGRIKESDKFFCENGKYMVANHILHDHRPHGTLTFSEVFEQSSNIGVTKIAQKLGPKVIYDYAYEFRFGILTGIDLPGEVEGILKHYRKWSKTSIGAVPIGHEVAVTLLQLAMAVSVIANDGIYMKPFVVQYIKDRHGEIIETFEPQEVAQVITSNTARRIKSILEKVVEQGTGRRARIRGVRVAGKTGTAQKVIDGTYSHSKFYATFIGFAPVEDPKITVVVMFDEPQPQHFGGTVAAPVFKEVVRDTLKYLSTKR